MKTPTPFLLLLIVALSACTGILDERANEEINRAQSPLIGGTVDTEDPAVVALMRGGNLPFCTGTLISPRVILTAAHCVDMLGADPSASIYFGSDSRGDGARVSVRRKKQHPMWNGNVGAYDVAMLLMDFPYQDLDIIRGLNVGAPIDDRIGADYRHVGFGVYDRDTNLADGRKRTGTTTITGTAGDIIRSGDSEVSVCFGDSGGPAFLTIDGQEVVAGIHSYTNGEDCQPPNGDTNVQFYAEDFILPWIQANDLSCRLDGVCSKVGCTDDPDCLPCGPDGTCVTDCPLPDPDCRTQAVGEICRANSQCTTDLCAVYRKEQDYRFCTETCTPSNDTCPSGMHCEEVPSLGNICYWDKKPPGALGDSCENPTDCGTYECSEGLCVSSCDLSLGLICPESFKCETHNEGEDYFCFGEPSSDGGCSASSTNSGGIGLALLALFGLLRRKRRWMAR